MTTDTGRVPKDHKSCRERSAGSRLKKMWGADTEREISVFLTLVIWTARTLMQMHEAETASPENSKTYLGYVKSISGVHTEYHMLRHYLEDHGLTYLCGAQFRVHPTTVVKNSSRRCGRWRLSFTAEQVARLSVCASGVRLPTEIMEELGLALEVDPGFFTTMLIPRDSPSIVGRYMQKRVVAP